jgi:hypothetical protein
MRYAQISGNTAVAFLEGHPDDWPDLRDAAVLRPCGPEVQAGWLWNGQGFSPSPSAPKVPIGPLAFRRRFTQAERSAITLAASRGLEAGDATLQVWLDDLNSSQEVDLDSPTLIAGVSLLVSSGLLDESRVAIVLAP